MVVRPLVIWDLQVRESALTQDERCRDEDVRWKSRGRRNWRRSEGLEIAQNRGSGTCVTSDGPSFNRTNAHRSPKTSAIFLFLRWQIPQPTLG